MENRKFKKRFTGFAALAAALMLAFNPPVMAEAAVKTKTTTQVFYCLDGLSKKLPVKVYGKDTLALTWNISTKNIVSVKGKQTPKNIAGVNMIEKGGMKVQKVSAKVWKVTATWYLNTKPLKDSKVGSAVCRLIPQLKTIAGYGRFLRVREVYTLKGNGTIRKTSQKYSVVLPEKLQNTIEDLLILLELK
ncbi:MAG: hypothetical protein IJ899_17300 [Blautia sp.]|nr:hypothetical protein [Blautia sp.]